MSQSKSYLKFQQRFHKSIQQDPEAHAYSQEDFVEAWLRAIAKRKEENPELESEPDVGLDLDLKGPLRFDVESKLDINSQLETSFEKDALDELDMDAVYTELMLPRYDLITYRPSAFQSFCFWVELPETENADACHRFFVQVWKEYIKSSEANYEDDDYMRDFERRCFCGDGLDTAVREAIHGLLVKKGVIRL